jgi:hypothetical protein
MNRTLKCLFLLALMVTTMISMYTKAIYQNHKAITMKQDLQLQEMDARLWFLQKELENVSRKLDSVDERRVQDKQDIQEAFQQFKTKHVMEQDAKIDSVDERRMQDMREIQDALQQFETKQAVEYDAKIDNMEQQMQTFVTCYLEPFLRTEQWVIEGRPLFGSQYSENHRLRWFIRQFEDHRYNLITEYYPDEYYKSRGKVKPRRETFNPLCAVK